ncbi:MAG: prepilin-type N-terminal cleavage/methylation domain-containing protein [Spirochaetales bacterium]|nr:prepilin-type N-terminal cleavage/methylation domain-containing protein [Spirochaetales bacterium]
MKHTTGLPAKNKEDGFTFIEILVSVVILSVLGFSIWTGFIGVMNLIGSVPEATEKAQKLLALDSYLMQVCGAIKIPFWMPEAEIEEESDKVILPFYDGKKENMLSIEYKDKYIIITTSIIEEEETDEDEESGETYIPTFKAGPYDEVTFEIVSTKEEGLIGLDVSILETYDEYEPVKIFVRFGSYPFWKED